MDDNKTPVLDLNSLLPPKRVIRFGNPPKDVEVKSPSLESLLSIGTAAQNFEKVDTNDLEAMAAFFKAFTAEIVKCIPELEGETLNSDQLMKLAEMLMDMAMPKEQSELEKRGITVDTAKKKG